MLASMPNFAEKLRYVAVITCRTNPCPAFYLVMARFVIHFIPRLFAYARTHRTKTLQKKCHGQTDTNKPAKQPAINPSPTVVTAAVF